MSDPQLGLGAGGAGGRGPPADEGTARAPVTGSRAPEEAGGPGPPCLVGFTSHRVQHPLLGELGGRRSLRGGSECGASTAEVGEWRSSKGRGNLFSFCWDRSFPAPAASLASVIIAR